MARTHMIVDCTKPHDKQVSYVPFTPEEEAEADARDAARLEQAQKLSETDALIAVLKERDPTLAQAVAEKMAGEKG